MESAVTASGSAARWGPLWGARARDWATVEEQQAPTYEEGLRRAGLERGQSVLDIGCGTGVLLALAAARGARVHGVDASEALAALARERVPGADVRIGEMEALPYEDDSFDAVTVGFGARNVVDLDGGIAEMARVVRPGGRVVVLEITTPRRPPLSWFYAVWFDRIVPVLGTVAGDRDAYTYLPDSVRRFPPADELAALMYRAGLRDVRYLILAGGIIAIHSGSVPA